MASLSVTLGCCTVNTVQRKQPIPFSETINTDKLLPFSKTRNTPFKKTLELVHKYLSRSNCAADHLLTTDIVPCS